MIVSEYQSREYCRDIECKYQLAYDSGSMPKYELKKHCSICGAYQFHQWLQKNNYKIMKGDDEVSEDKCCSGCVYYNQSDYYCNHIECVMMPAHKCDDFKKGDDEVSESKMIPQINEIEPKRRGVELTVKSCFPEGQTIEEQAAKVDEEMNEVLAANSHESRAKEFLDVATSAIGAAEIEMKKHLEKELNEQEFSTKTVQEVLQGRLGAQYQRKQIEFAKEEQNGQVE